MLRSTLVIKYYSITQTACVQNYILQTPQWAIRCKMSPSNDTL